MNKDELKKYYLEQLMKMREKLVLFKNCEAKYRLLNDYSAYISALKHIGFLDDEEIKDLYEFIEPGKSNFRNYARGVLNTQKVYESHEDVKKVVDELIEVANDCETYEPELRYIDENEGRKLVMDFFKWVSDDCYNFYIKLLDAKHVISTNEPTLHSFSLLANYDGNLPFIVVGKGKKPTLYYFDVLVHEFGHAYSSYLCRNNSYNVYHSQYSEFFSILFEKLFLQYLEEKHLYLDEVKKIRRYDLSMRLDELKNAILVEELVEKGYIKDRYGFCLMPNVDINDIEEFLAKGYIPDKKEYFEAKKARKNDQEPVKVLDRKQKMLLNLLIKIFKNADHDKLNYESDNKKQIVNLRLKTIVETLGEGNYDNLEEVLIGLTSMKNKTQFRELIQEYTHYSQSPQFINLLLSNLTESEIKLKDEEAVTSLIQVYVEYVFNSNETIKPAIKQIFGSYCDEEDLRYIFNEINNMIKANDTITIDEIKLFCSNILANAISQEPLILEKIVDDLLELVYDKKASIQKRDIMKKYVDEIYTDNELSFAGFIDNVIEALSNSQYNQAFVIIDKFLEHLKASEDDRKKVLKLIRIINEDAKKKITELNKKSLLDAITETLKNRPEYDYHKYIMGRVLASYFASQIKINHTEGLKNAIEFIQLGDTYSYSEVLKMYPTAVFHAKEEIYEALTPEYEYQNGYGHTRRNNSTQEFIDESLFKEFKGTLEHVKGFDKEKHSPKQLFKEYTKR